MTPATIGFNDYLFKLDNANRQLQELYLKRERLFKLKDVLNDYDKKCKEVDEAIEELNNIKEECLKIHKKVEKYFNFRDKKVEDIFNIVYEVINSDEYWKMFLAFFYTKEELFEEVKKYIEAKFDIEIDVDKYEEDFINKRDDIIYYTYCGCLKALELKTNKEYSDSTKNKKGFFRNFFRRE